jgi:hypothetical protein
MPSSYNIYAFSYNNPSRKAALQSRFDTLGIPVHWTPPVLRDDPRIHTDPRTSAVMLNHLDMIRNFLASDAEFGIFCEDDILIRKSFAKDIQIAIDAYKRIQPSIMLLGYLASYKLAETTIHSSHTLVETNFSFLSVYNDLWGSQMYMMDRQSATRCIRLFEDQSRVSVPYSPDWTITKMENAVCIYPMLAVETGVVATDHWGQIQFHKQCFDTQFIPDLYF